jgi:hypothetical protein
MLGILGKLDGTNIHGFLGLFGRLVRSQWWWVGVANSGRFFF